MKARSSGASAPLSFPSKLSEPVKQRKPRRLPDGVASFAEYAYRRYRDEASLTPIVEVAAQRHALSSEDRRFLNIMIRGFEERIVDMMCELVRDREVTHG